jgi:CheY-like chemotaxis protein
MPVVQGNEVCAELKADPATATIPVVLLTARASEDDVARGFENGADEYLTAFRYRRAREHPSAPDRDGKLVR